MRTFLRPLLLAAVFVAALAPQASAGTVLDRRITVADGTVFRLVVATVPASAGRVKPLATAFYQQGASWHKIGTVRVANPEAARNVFPKGSRFLRVARLVKVADGFSVQLLWHVTGRGNVNTGWLAANRSFFNPAG
jgi:hypothetical protein